MKPADPPSNAALFLEELRSIAQNGLHYAANPYDTARYERLLELASVEYAKLSGLSQEVVRAQVLAERGHITPKVGLNAAIITSEEKFLLARRSDDGCWCLPCGGAELGERPEEGIAREVWEETGLTVKVGPVIEVFSRLPGEYGELYTSYNILYLCEVTGGTLTPSFETPEVGYFDLDEVTPWHKDHEARARFALAFWRERNRNLG